MASFLAALDGETVLLMDGAMGTELHRQGLALAGSAPAWCLTHPGKVLAVHRAYRQAGAVCLLTNTFQNNPPALAAHGLGDRFEEISEAAVRLARSAAGPAGYVIGDIGPILAAGPPPAPEGYQDFPDRRLLRRVAGSLAGADALLLETCSSPQALLAVEYLYRDAPELEGVPLLLSLTYRRDGQGRLTTLTGHPPELFARHALRHGVAALGVNCGRDVGLAEVVEVLGRYRAVTDLPLLARPNAGTPTRLPSGEWAYPVTPREMAGALPGLLGTGVRLLGGCCGTTPAHIAALRAALSGG